MSRGRWILACGLFALLAQPNTACTSDANDTTAQCEGEKIDRFKELIIVDEGVLDDARAKNANAGPWSFRHAVENMTAPEISASEFVRSWLTGWVSVKQVNGFPTDRPNEERDGKMQAAIVCPWLKRTPANACNDDCSMCTGHELDLALAPFRLIAIVNRLDLGDEVASEPNGEGRLVFALTDGPADDPTSHSLAMSVVFEYLLPESRTRQQWAAAFHELGKQPAMDEAYRAALENVTNGFTKRGMRPSAPNGSAIGQVRTNESVLNWIWQQREFGLSSGLLALRPVRNTPGEALNNSTVLQDWVAKNADAILANRYELTETLRAGSADQLLYTWRVPGVDEKLRRAFAAGTCNGCHSSEQPNIDTAFHVSPFRKGTDKLSPFLVSPTGGSDELGRRERLNAKVRCTGTSP